MRPFRRRSRPELPPEQFRVRDITVRVRQVKGDLIFGLDYSGGRLGFVAGASVGDMTVPLGTYGGARCFGSVLVTLYPPADPRPWLAEPEHADAIAAFGLRRPELLHVSGNMVYLHTGLDRYPERATIAERMVRIVELIRAASTPEDHEGTAQAAAARLLVAEGVDDDLLELATMTESDRAAFLEAADTKVLVDLVRRLDDLEPVIGERALREEADLVNALAGNLVDAEQEARAVLARRGETLLR